LTFLPSVEGREAVRLAVVVERAELCKQRLNLPQLPTLLLLVLVALEPRVEVATNLE
jgi:hypothetical protein